MTNRAEYIATLFKKYLDGNLSVEEETALRTWAQSYTKHQQEYNNLTDPAFTADKLRQWISYNDDEFANRLTQRFPALAPGQLSGKMDDAARSVDTNESGENTPAPVHSIPSSAPGRHFLKTKLFKYAAAIIIAISGIGIYYLSTRPEPKIPIVQTSQKPLPDVLPGSDKAILTLSDGTKVELDNATSETINDGTLSIKNESGQLVYNDPARGSISPAGGSGAGGAEGGSRGSAARIAMNTMSTPKGGQYRLTLADGTNVWLNAASSITYPTAFKGKTREVTITGEAYFEVTKDKEKPFIVQTPEDQITVLGTSFNINTYPDEIPKTTLVSGSIMMTRASAGAPARTETVLRPGEAWSNGKVTQGNVTQATAWMRGIFDFNGVTFASVMRQVERWYDVEVEYKTKIPERTFYGELSRQLTLSQLLEILDVMKIGYTMQGRKIVIK